MAISPLRSYAQKGTIGFENYTTANGMSRNRITCITHDKQGYMWLGSLANGLMRYDGYLFKVYRIDPADNNSLQREDINWLHCDRVGRVWIGTNKVLQYYDLKNGHFTFPSKTFDSHVQIVAAVRHTFQIAGTYLCYPVKVNFTTPSLNPNYVYKLMNITNAVYYFYRDSFGDWMMGKEGKETTEETVNNYATNSLSNYPKPYFSDMSPCYEVTNYEYPKLGGDKMIIHFKTKDKEPPLFFNMEYRDKYGVLVGWTVPICCSTALCETETGTGTVGMETTYIPALNDMPRVVSAKVLIPH